MATIKRFEDLQTWQMARLQCKEIYTRTQQGNFFNDFELKDQINRFSGSVMDNFAEGFERFTNRDFRHFLVIAKGSNGELRSQLYRAFDRGHISEIDLNEMLNQSGTLGVKIFNFINYLDKTEFATKPTIKSLKKKTNNT